MPQVVESARAVKAAADELVIACNAKVSLRRYWNATLNEAVPPEILKLLSKLR